MKATLREPEIVTRKGKPVSVILPIATTRNCWSAPKTPPTWPGSDRRAKNLGSIVRSKRISPGASDHVSHPAGNARRRKTSPSGWRNSRPYYYRDSSPCSQSASARLPKTGRQQNDWRIRVGDYRVVYEIADEIRIVRVNRVRHRREVHR